MTDIKHPQDKDEDLEDEEDLSFVEDEETKLTEGISAASKLKKLREELNKCQAEKQEYLAGWQRAKADYINLKKESDKEKQEIGAFAKSSFVSEILPVLDSFHMAFGNKETWEQAPENWRKGVEYIHTQLLNILRDHGVEVIEEVRVAFNPEIHQAIGTIDTSVESEDNLVLEVVKPGYKMKEKVVRPASVKVGIFNK